jgi:hypothetical protein
MKTERSHPNPLPRSAPAVAAGLTLLGPATALAQGADPFAAPAAPTAPAGEGGVRVIEESYRLETNISVNITDGSTSAACEHITGAICTKQNNSMLGVAAAYVGVCVLVACLLRAWFNKRATGSNAFRFIFPMFLAAAGATALVALDPAAGADLRCCLESSVFRSQIILQDSNLGRAALFGLLPAIVLYTLVVFVISKIRR